VFSELIVTTNLDPGKHRSVVSWHMLGSSPHDTKVAEPGVAAYMSKLVYILYLIIAPATGKNFRIWDEAGFFVLVMILAFIGLESGITLETIGWI
jgi:hypothetical protein